MRFLKLIILVFLVLKSAISQDMDCYAPDSTPGNCISYRNCEYILKLINNSAQNMSATEIYLRRAICGFDGVDLLICCPNFVYRTSTEAAFIFFGVLQPTSAPVATNYNTRSALPTNNANSCGMSNGSHTRVVGGNNAELNAWPWMAILGYRSSFDSNPRYQCGGTLITQTHVLSAAHCIKDSLYVVRLGEYDLTSDSDGASPIDMSIQWKIAHEDYNSKLITNDISLIKLTQNAPFNDMIRPICLPTSEALRTKNLDYYQPFVAGWGTTSFRGSVSGILQEVQLPIVPTAQCAVPYQTLYSSQVFDDRVLCAGFLQGGRDACQGDSGGPLMLPQASDDGTHYYWNLIGIVSYGYECARPGFPGVYTRVSTFIPWIESRMSN